MLHLFNFKIIKFCIDIEYFGHRIIENHSKSYIKDVKKMNIRINNCKLLQFNKHIQSEVTELKLLPFFVC